MLLDDVVLERWFDQTTAKRGRGYFREGRVETLDMVYLSDDSIEMYATVKGSGRNRYQTEVSVARWADGRLFFHSTCDCPVGLGCKHAAAVLLEAQLEEKSSGNPGNSQEIEQQRFDYWLESFRGAATPYGTGDKGLLVYTLQPSRYRADLDFCVWKTRRLKKGGYGRPAQYGAWSTCELDNRPPAHLQADDVPVLAWLRSLSGNSPVYSPSVRGRSGAGVLEAALATGRLFFGEVGDTPLRLGPSRDLTVDWQADEQGRFALKPKLVDGRQHALPTEPPYYLDAAAGLVGRLNTPLTGAQIGVLLASPPVRPEVIQQKFPVLEPVLKRLSLGLPGEQDTPEVIRAKPVPGLVLHSTELDSGEVVHSVWPYFLYDDVVLSAVEMDDSLTIERDGKTVIVMRDDAAEELAHETWMHDFVPVVFQSLEGPFESFSERRSKYESIADNWVPEFEEDWPKIIVERLPAMQADGWQITFSDDFKLLPQEADDWYNQIESAEEDGWFDIDAGIELNGRQVSLVPLLHQLLADWQPGKDLPEELLLPLEDCVLKVPSQRLQPLLETLYALYDRISDDEGIRLPRLESAMLLGTSSMQWQGGERLQSLGKQLADFDGLPRVAVPDGLQAELRSYQQTGLDWLQFLRSAELGGVLADDMGLGKTLQTLAHLLAEKQAGRLQQPALVVCPTSLIHNWQSESARFTPALTVLRLHGPKRKKDFARIAEHDVVITSYPLLQRDADLHIEQPYAIAVFDEAQNLKNPRVGASRVARKLKVGQRIALTGTPMENHLGELWSLFDLLLPGYLGNASEFGKHFRKPIERGDSPERQQALSRRVRPFLLRRSKEQVAPELPEKTEMLRSVELSPAQRDLYETIRASMDSKIKQLMSDKGVARSQIEILEALLRLRQVCCHPQLLNDGHDALASAKLDYLLEMLDELLEEGRTIIIFSQFTSMLSLIEAALQKRSLDYALLTGQTRDRKAAVERFQSGKVALFLISLKAGGVGLNLTAADCVIHFDPWWNPAVERQATDRAWRIGQDKPVFVYRLICEGTVEERMQALQARKAQLADSIYDGKETFATALTADDVQVLLQPLDS